MAKIDESMSRTSLLDTLLLDTMTNHERFQGNLYLCCHCSQKYLRQNSIDVDI